MSFPTNKKSILRLVSLFLVFSVVSSSDVESSSVAPSPSRATIAGEKQPATQMRIEVNKKKKPKVCRNKLSNVLSRVGFSGESHRIAWAIAMRESRGNKKAISDTNDYGLFQFNKATWGKENWWDDTRLLKSVYNAKIAYKISRGGETWYPWGLSGKGTLRAKAYRNIGWSKSKIRSHIKKPYKKFYRKYASLPKKCRVV